MLHHPGLKFLCKKKGVVFPVFLFVRFFFRGRRTFFLSRCTQYSKSSCHVLFQKQVRRVYEILRLRITDSSNPDELREYRLDVKKRLNIPFQVHYIWFLFLASSHRRPYKHAIFIWNGRSESVCFVCFGGSLVNTPRVACHHGA